MKRSIWPWIPFALLAIFVGSYPLTYFLFDVHDHGILKNKPLNLRNDPFYLLAFYTHISMGGLALLIGWMQFSKRLRLKNIRLHRFIGKVYVLAVLCSSLAGLTIALFADGGIISTLGFGLLAILWLFTDIAAYVSIRKLNTTRHRDWMIRNYCLCFAAVTLRIYLPFSLMVMHAGFMDAYRLISWMCWVPNLILAELLIWRLHRNNLTVQTV
jgi:uncharacterized membrane protein